MAPLRLNVLGFAAAGGQAGVGGLEENTLLARAEIGISMGVLAPAKAGSFQRVGVPDWAHWFKEPSMRPVSAKAVLG